MNLKSVYGIAKTFVTDSPSYVIFFITARCNSKCKMCFYWRHLEHYSRQKELSLEEIKKISKNLCSLEYLSLSGGEPFLRDDLPDIVETFVKNNNVQVMSIPNNGTMPERVKTLFEKILKKCPKTSFRVPLALDGIGKDHDYIRGFPGNFKKFLQTYKVLDSLRKKYPNFNLDIATCLSVYNKKKIKKIIEYVDKNFDADNHVLGLARGDTRNKIAKDVSIKEYAEAKRMIEKVARKRENRRKGIKMRALKALKLVNRDVIEKILKEKKAIINCMAGRKMAVIGETGDVYPCEILNMKIGNLRENNYDIKKLLSSKKAKKIKKHIKDTKCFCTFECAMQNSLIYNPKVYPALIKRFIEVK